MLIPTTDGKGMVEINYVDAQLKLACLAEQQGDLKKAKKHFDKALRASEVSDNG